VVTVSQGRYAVIYERDESGAWNARGEAQTAVRRARSARAKVARDQKEAAEAARVAARCLAELDRSVRDAGEVLEISHQRAQQILAG
jgi:hypothetical protein